MKKKSKTICIIPARGGSKGLPGKNLRIFNGKPLIAWPIIAAKNCNRIDNVIVFNSLTKKDLYQIIDLQMDDLKKNLLNKSNKLNLTKTAKDVLLQEGTHREWGARPLRRIIQDQIENALSLKFLKNEFASSFKLSDAVVLCPVYSAGEKIKYNFKQDNFSRTRYVSICTKVVTRR